MKLKGERGESGFWSTNPGTGWWLVGSVLGIAVLGAGAYGVYRYADARKERTRGCHEYRDHEYCLSRVGEADGSPTYAILIDGERHPVPPMRADLAHEEAKRRIDGMEGEPDVPVPTPDPPTPDPVPILEPDEPVASEEPGQVEAAAVAVPLVRHGTIADPASMTVAMETRPEWLSYARDYLSQLGFAGMNKDSLAGVWSRAFPPSMGVGDGWTIVGRPWSDLVEHAGSWLTDANAGTYVTPIDYDRFAAAALVSLGEAPPEWSVLVSDIAPGDLLLGKKAGTGDHTIAVRYREEKLPGETDRYWEWLTWAPGVYELRDGNLLRKGRANDRDAAVSDARQFVRDYVTAVGVT